MQTQIIGQLPSSLHAARRIAPYPTNPSGTATSRPFSVLSSSSTGDLSAATEADDPDGRRRNVDAVSLSSDENSGFVGFPDDSTSSEFTLACSFFHRGELDHAEVVFEKLIHPKLEYQKSQEQITFR